METMTRAPRASSGGRSCSSQASTPGFCRPTELSIPAVASHTRGAGLPSQGKGDSDLAVTAPSAAGSPSRATSSPCP